MRYQGVLRDRNGSVLSGYDVTVYRKDVYNGTRELATTYTDNTLTSEFRNPVKTISSGVYEFFVHPGVYELELPTGVSGEDPCIEIVELGISAGEWGGGGYGERFEIRDADGNSPFSIDADAGTDTVVLGGGNAAGNLAIGSDGADEGEGVIFLKQATVDPTSLVSGSAYLFFDGTDIRGFTASGSIAPAGLKDEIADYNKYQPNGISNPNTLVDYTDEFIGGSDAEWRAAEYGDAATSVLAVDRYDAVALRLEGSGGSDVNVYTYLRDTPPGTSDSTIASRLTCSLEDTTDVAAGLAVVMTGTEAAPTRVEFFTVERTTGSQYSLVHSRSSLWDWATRTEISSEVIFDTILANSNRTQNSLDVFIALHFDKNDGLFPHYSMDGFNFRALGGGVAMSQPPISAGLLAVNEGNASITRVRSHWYRALDGLTLEVGS